jgi:type II secretory pathway component PulF
MMPNFKYKVRDRLDKPIAGTIDAPKLQSVGDRLYQRGYFPVTIEEERNAVSLRKVKEGSSLTDAITESGKFTPLVIQMLSVGESSGTLDEMLWNLASLFR